MKAGLLWAVDFGPCYVAGQKIGGELNAVKTALEPIRQRFNGAGLGQARGAFHQQVAVRQQGDNEALYQVRLANYLAAEPVFEKSYVCACHAFSCFFLSSEWFGRRG